MDVHHPFVVQVVQHMDRHSMLPEGSTVVAGVSGGPDSMCLLHLLHGLSGWRGWHLRVAHINHLLRGDESDGDESFVSEYCCKAGIPFHVLRADIREMSREAGESIETTARRVRYRFFGEIADLQACDGPVRIAVAHHREDQAETLLMHLFRGSGLDGLCGMPPVSGRIVRPLLEASRSVILAYLSEMNVPYRMDSTNARPDATRNRVRLELLPLAADIFGPNPAGRVAGTAAMLREDAAWLLSAASSEAALIRRGTGVDRTALLALPGAIAVRILRILYEEATGSRTDLGRDHLVALLGLAGTIGRHAALDLPGGVRAECEGDIFRMAARVCAAGTASGWPPVPLALRGVTATPAGSFIAGATMAEVRTGSFAESVPVAFRASALVDAVLRTRLPGDWIRPAGHMGSRSLKRYFIDRKINVAERGQMPLIASGGNIAWIPGLAASSEFLWNPECDSVTDCVWLAYCPQGGIIG